MFTAVALDRETIAQELNSELLPADQLADDDPRLTDEVCQEFADKYGDWLNDTANEWGSTPDWGRLVKAILTKIGMPQDQEERSYSDIARDGMVE